MITWNRAVRTFKVSRATRRRARTMVRRALRRVSFDTPRISESDLIKRLTRSTDADTLRNKLKGSMCRDSFWEFVKTFWPVIVPEKMVENWHMEYICNLMQKVAERVFANKKKKYDVVLNVPPGTSKSTICSVMFPAWVWTRMQSARLICCSFSEKLALRLSRLSRDVIKSDLYRELFPDVQLRADQDTKGEFATIKGGVRFAIGSGTQVMGSHAHFILIDDPIDPQGVLSDNELARINNWIDEQLSGRKVDKEVTVTIMIAQRLHQDDPPARMGEKKPVKWVKIPATDEAEIRPKRLKDYYKNGLMDPKRLTRKSLEAVRQGPRGEYVYAGQYLQRPTPPGGGLFKTDRIVIVPPNKKLPKFKSVVRFWDKAGTKGGGAYTVGVKMGMTADNRIYVLDVIRVQLDTFERERLIRQTARLDGKQVIVGIEQSGGEGGKESAENTVRRLVGFRVKVLRPERDKEQRAEPVSVQVNAGNMFVVKKHWTKAYISELNYFPYGRFADQIDSTSGAFSILTRSRKQVGGMRRGQTEYRPFSRWTKLYSYMNGG